MWIFLNAILLFICSDSYSLVLDGNEAVVFEDAKVKSVYLNDELQG